MRQDATRPRRRRNYGRAVLWYGDVTTRKVVASKNTPTMNKDGHAVNSNPLIRKPFGGRSFRRALALAAAGGLLSAANAQEADAEDDEAVELRPVVVTGSRLNRPGTELSGNLIVLDADAIRATGEVTVAGVLRQLPQNINGTSEVLGSTLNGARNFSGAATVNLRGIGSDSTLILVDGRRIGYSGILGGVTDVSTISLNMVERIEILLDGSSAVYGSEAVGGVVNIITKKDYQGVDVNINYARPHKSGYSETTVGVSGGFPWQGGRATLGYEFFNDSGLDASGRESIVNYSRDGINNQKNAQPGPQMRVWTWFFDDSCNAARAVVYRLNGRIITRAEYAALDAAEQAAAECHADVTLPLGFMPGDDLNGIQIFGAPNWGEATERGYSLLYACWTTVTAARAQRFLSVRASISPSTFLTSIPLPSISPFAFPLPSLLPHFFFPFLVPLLFPVFSLSFPLPYPHYNHLYLYYHGGLPEEEWNRDSDGSGSSPAGEYMYTPCICDSPVSCIASLKHRIT